MARRRESASGTPLLSGRYRYDGELARGSTGRVIGLVDRDGSRRVGKVLAPEVGALAQWELDALVGVRSPHLVTALELLRPVEALGAPFSIPRGAWVLVETRAEGEPSASVLAGIEDLARRAERVLDATIGVARALDALHDAGLGHGDVKPENVLLEAAHATLVDLGGARPFGRSATISGTLAYMPPEAREGERTAATDLYALGATIHAWLWGQPPAAGEPLRWPSWAPDGLVAVATALLAERVADRPRDAREVIVALRGERPDTTRERRDRRAPLVGGEEALARLLALLDADGWAAVVGPSGSGRSRLVEEAARAVQRRVAQAGGEPPTYLHVPDAPPALSAPTFVHLDGARLTAEAATRVLAEGRIAGHAHRVVLELDTASGLEGARVVSLPALSEEEVRTLIAALLGTAPSIATARAAREATGGLPGRIVRGVASLATLELDAQRATDWRMVARAAGLPRLPKHAASVAALGLALGGTLTLASADARLTPELSDGARWLLREGLATLDAAGGLVLHPRLSDAIGEGSRARALRDALGVRSTLAGLSRAILDAHAHDVEAANRLALRLIDEARERGEPEDAASLASRYLHAVPTRPGEARDVLVLARVDALRASGALGEALEALADARQACAAELARAELSRLLGRTEEALSIARRHVGDVTFGERALALIARTTFGSAESEALTATLSRARDPEAGARAAETRALAAMRADGPEKVADAIAAAREGRAHADAIAVRATRLTWQSRLTSLEAQALALAGRLDEARALHGESARLASAAGDRLLEATFRSNEGLAMLEHGDLGHALLALEAGARLFLRLGRPRELARTLTNLANALGIAGDDARARAVLDEAHRALVTVDDPEARALAAIVESELLVRRGKLRAAATTLDAAAAHGAAASTAPSDRGLTSIVRARLSSVWTALGDLAAAAAALSEARDQGPVPRAERALAASRLALAERALPSAEAALREAEALVTRGQIGFEVRVRVLAIEVELSDAAGRREDVRAALGRLRAILEPALGGLTAELQSRFRQIPLHRRALAEGRAAADDRASQRDVLSQRALDGLAALAREERPELLEAQLAELALGLTAAERAFVVEWTVGGPVVRARAGAALLDAGARPSYSIVARALREPIVVSTDAIRDEDASSSVHALALRSVLAVELGPRPVGAAPRVLVIDDPLRASAFDATLVDVVRTLADVAGPLLTARREARRARARERRALRREAAAEADVRRLRETVEPLAIASVDDLDPFSSFVHVDASSRRVVEEARRLSAADLPLLLAGESGVGKDLLARAIHRCGPRRHEPLVVERGAALAGPLADALVFGHTRGAFTGAESARKGLFELADHGTLCLDGIEDIPPEMQARLLRILVEREVRPLGASRTRHVDVRVIATTRLDPADALTRGVWREDFYYRVAGAVLVVPPLRERPGDLDALVARALARSGRAVTLAPRAAAALRARRWPGNVRELEHALHDAILRLDGAVLDLGVAPAPTGASPDAARPATLHEQRGALTRELVLATLEAHHGNRTHAARALGLSRFGLQKMLRRLASGEPDAGSDDQRSK